MTNASPTSDRSPWIGIQIGAHSLYDEGIEHALDLLRDTCQVNALVVGAFGGGYRGGKWLVDADRRADHGVRLPDPPHHCPATWVRTHEEHYRGLRHRWPSEPDTHYGDGDILDDCAAAAAERGMALYPRLFECRAELQMPSEWAELDAEGRATGQKCVNNPDWNDFSRATVEDLATHHPQIAGVVYFQERHGPMEAVFGKPNVDRSLVGHCFCEHCCRSARERGIDVERARTGYREFVALAQAGMEDGPRPSDGWFVSFWRLFTRYPEIQAWEQLWWDGLHRHRQGLYRAIKGVRRDLRVGWHLHHPMSFDPFYRAGMDYARIGAYSDWVKPNIYPVSSGGRSRNSWCKGIMRTLFKDLRPETAINFLYDILGYDAAEMPSIADYLSDEQMPGWGTDYVARETRRAVAGFGDAAAVYPGLGFDMPCGGDSPESVYEHTRAVFENGAPGVLLAREYEEMQVVHLEAVGRALADMGLVPTPIGHR